MRALDLAAGGHTEHPSTIRAQRQVGTGQDVPVIIAERKIDAVCRAVAIDIGECDTGRILFGIDCLHADIPGQHAQAHFLLDIELQICGHQLFGDAVGLGRNVVRRVGIEHKRAVRDQVAHIVADDRA